MDLDLHCLFGLHVFCCTHWLRPRNPPPPIPPHLASLVDGGAIGSQDNGLFVTPCIYTSEIQRLATTRLFVNSRKVEKAYFCFETPVNL
jgi:hypothetical protein